MSTNNDNRNYDRDYDQQGNDRDQNQNQSQNQGQNQNQDYSSRDEHRGGRQNEEQRDRSGSMDSRDIESRWMDIESDYRRRHTNLTDMDVNFREGEFHTLTDQIAKRTNRTQDEVVDEIINWPNH
ncbi:hypothetical protein [uncultured Gelidibacter sp.]|uniref:hypothetical protein n=1 Tax=uncultured Gelidibacter sp. TaxID=259318 RepID=UPI00261346B8|nr:hypothetical protein [uncultured Gelidibacter sp.]